MSQIALDQLLSIAAPSPKPRESAQPAGSSKDSFRSHLDRAQEAAEPKTPKSDPPSKSSATDEEAPVESESQDQELSSGSTEESTPTNENQEVAEEESQKHDDEHSQNDEVTLSAAAQVVVPQPVPENSQSEQDFPSQPQVVETSAGSEQEQPQDQRLNSVEQAAGDTEPTSSLVIPEQVETTEPLATTVTTTAEIETSPSENSQPQDQQQEQAVATSTVVEQASSGAKTQRFESPDSPTTQAAESTQAAALAAEQEAAAEQFPESKTHAAKADRPHKSQAANKAEPIVEVANETPEASEPTVETSTAATPTSAPAKLTSEANLSAIRAIGSTDASVSNSSVPGSESSSSEMSTVDRSRFVQRVGGAIRSAQQRDGQIQLRLSPPELGSLKIEIAVKDGVITARLETDNPAARTLILDNLPALRERLAEQQIRIEKFDVDVGRDGQQQAQQGPGDRPTNGQREPTNRPNQAQRQQTITPSQVPTTSNTNDQTGLDVRI